MAVSKIPNMEAINAYINSFINSEGTRAATQALNQFETPLNIARGLAGEISRIYATVQSLQYDEDGNVSDVTPDNALSYAKGPVNNALQQLRQWSVNIDTLVELASASTQQNPRGLQSIKYAIGSGYLITLNIEGGVITSVGGKQEGSSGPVSLTSGQVSIQPVKITGFPYYICFMGAVVQGSTKRQTAIVKEINSNTSIAAGISTDFTFDVSLAEYANDSNLRTDVMTLAAGAMGAGTNLNWLTPIPAVTWVTREGEYTTPFDMKPDITDLVTALESIA